MYNFQRPVQQTLTGFESLRLFISWWWWLHLTEGRCTLWGKKTLNVHSLVNCPTRWIIYGIPFLPYSKKEFISHRITMHFAFSTLFFIIAPLCKSSIVTLYLTAVIIFLFKCNFISHNCDYTCRMWLSHNCDYISQKCYFISHDCNVTYILQCDYISQLWLYFL